MNPSSNTPLVFGVSFNPAAELCEHLRPDAWRFAAQNPISQRSSDLRRVLVALRKQGTGGAV